MKVCSVCLRCYEDAIFSCSEKNHESLAAARSGSIEIIPDYRIECLLQIDGAAESYQAVNIVSDQPCVINIISVGLFKNNKEIYSSFLGEARLIAELEHPKVARIFESGILPDGSLYVVSEYFAGKNLGEFLNESKTFSEISAVAIAGQTADALEAIHRAG